jgi:anti-anti-sigma regulatory factor/anti-sigma regulatory factor (Ser/Thr protein kinase)
VGEVSPNSRDTDRDLRCELEERSPVAVVRLAGWLDMTTAIKARAVLHKALAAQPAAIVVDLAGLVIEDDIALTVFSAFARTAAGWPGCPVLLCGADDQLRVALDRTRVNRAVAVHPERAQALPAAEAVPAPRRFHQRLPGTLGAAAVARQLVGDACRIWGLVSLIEDVEVVVTELVSNALRYTTGEVELSMMLRERFLHLSVCDNSHAPPRLVLTDPDTGMGGRGLVLVDALTAGWGSVPTADGKYVWATLRIPG